MIKLLHGTASQIDVHVTVVIHLLAKVARVEYLLDDGAAGVAEW